MTLIIPHAKIEVVMEKNNLVQHHLDKKSYHKYDWPRTPGTEICGET